MRLFVAVSLNRDVVHAAEQLVLALQRRASAIAPRAQINWVPSDRMHLTLRFIGHVEPPAAERISAVLATPFPQHAFPLSLAGPGVFPPRGAPRVLWVGITSGSEELQQVRREVEARLATVGLPPDERAFSPHLTLARVRDAVGLRSRDWLEPAQSARVGTTRVDAITLYESRLSPKGPTYVPLQHSLLTPA